MTLIINPFKVFFWQVWGKSVLRVTDKARGHVLLDPGIVFPGSKTLQLDCWILASQGKWAFVFNHFLENPIKELTLEIILM